MSLAFKEDDVPAVDIPGCSPENMSELCSVSYDNEGRIALIVNNTSGVKEYRSYHEVSSWSSKTVDSFVIRTFFDRDDNFLTSHAALL